MNIIIPVGGKGERFKNSNFNMPKPLIKIFEKEMIFYVLDNLKFNKDDKIYIIYYNLNDYNFKNLILNKYKNINLIEIDKQTLGAAETILLGISYIKIDSTNTKNVILDCDTYYTENILDFYRNKENNAIFYTENKDINPIYSYIIHDNNIVTDIKEKHKISDNANTGIYCFNNILQLEFYCKYIIENNIKFNNEFYISCVINEMIKNNILFEPIKLDSNYIYNLGTPEQLNKYINNTYLFLFDLDGTIVLTDNIYYDVWFKILRDYNIELTKDIFKKYIQGNSDNIVLQNFQLNNSKDILENISKIKDELFINNINKIKIVDGIDKFIENIRLNGHKIGIVTNCNRIVAEYILKYINIFNKIDIIVIGNECNKPKPYPEPYLEAIKYFNTTNNKAIIFEDSLTGIQSGKNAFPKCLIGIQTIYDDNILKKNGANISIQNYENINIDEILNYNSMEKNQIEKFIKNSLSQLDINKIEFDNHKLKGGFISDVIGVKIYGKDTNLDCVIKLENKNDTNLSKMANILGLYEREYYFYEIISKYVPVKIPNYYGLIKDDNFNNIGILMNNLNNLDYKLNLDLNIEKIDISLKIIERMAQLHSKFWNKDLKNIFTELKKHNDSIFNPVWNIFIKEKWINFKKKWQNILTNEQIKKAEDIVNNFQHIQDYLSEKNLTLCHGDIKSPNIFYNKIEDNYEPYFIDWQYVCIGKGVQDLVFFMIESFDITVINKYKTIFKEYYYIKLIENGVINYNINDYYIDFDYSIKYFPFFVALWFGTLNSDELIDKNFPFFFIKKLFNFLN